MDKLELWRLNPFICLTCAQGVGIRGGQAVWDSWESCGIFSYINADIINADIINADQHWLQCALLAGGLIFLRGFPHSSSLFLTDEWKKKEMDNTWDEPLENCHVMGLCWVKTQVNKCCESPAEEHPQHISLAITLVRDHFLLFFAIKRLISQNTVATLSVSDTFFLYTHKQKPFWSYNLPQPSDIHGVGSKCIGFLFLFLELDVRFIDFHN